MILVSLVTVEKSYGSWPVLQGVDLEVSDTARIGIVGPNGAGKSTILRILKASEAPTAGEVVRRKDLVVADLPQHVDGDERTAEQTVLAARPDVATLDAEMRAVESELGQGWERVKGNSRLGWDKARLAARDAWHNVERALPGDADGDGR